jgi:hypothetical protein
VFIFKKIVLPGIGDIPCDRFGVWVGMLSDDEPAYIPYADQNRRSKYFHFTLAFGKIGLQLFSLRPLNWGDKIKDNLHGKKPYILPRREYVAPRSPPSAIQLV